MSAVDPRAPVSHLDAALMRVSDAVIVCDLLDGVSFINASAEKLIGRQRPTVVGERLSTVLSIVDAVTGMSIDAAVAEARSSDLETTQPRNAVLLGGSEGAIIVEYSVSALRDADGAYGGSVTVFRDVMRRRTAELALQTSEDSLLANAEALFEEKERARVTLDSIGDAVISTDFRGHVTFLNAVAEKMTGWSQADASGRLLDETVLLVDTATRQHQSSPAMRAIIENRTIRIDSTCALIKRDGTESAVEVSASPIHDKDQGIIGAVVVAHDVTVARDLSAKLARQALYDSLTGLPNRTLLSDRLDQALDRARRLENMVSLLFIDLDRFKPVNDSLGHAIGDELLKAVAARLHGCVRSTDTLCRYGGDEFIIVLTDIATLADAATCAGKVIAALDAPFDLGDHRVRIGASVGIAYSATGITAPAALLKNADVAMYHAKSAGRNQFRFFGPEMETERLE